MSGAEEIARQLDDKVMLYYSIGEVVPASLVPKRRRILAEVLESYAAERVAEERERCAKIADAVAYLASSRTSWIDPAIISTAEMIAARIREGENG